MPSPWAWAWRQVFSTGSSTWATTRCACCTYPGVDREVFRANPNQVRAGEHSDYGSITLLFQDDRGGLQVKSPSGRFVDATPIDDTVVINAGDLLARWSNDTIKSTVHRVVEPPLANGDWHPPRYSIAWVFFSFSLACFLPLSLLRADVRDYRYFCNPNFKNHIEAIPGYVRVGGGQEI